MCGIIEAQIFGADEVDRDVLVTLVEAVAVVGVREETVLTGHTNGGGVVVSDHTPERHTEREENVERECVDVSCRADHCPWKRGMHIS